MTTVMDFDVYQGWNLVNSYSEDGFKITISPDYGSNLVETNNLIVDNYGNETNILSSTSGSKFAFHSIQLGQWSSSSNPIEVTFVATLASGATTSWSFTTINTGEMKTFYSPYSGSDIVSLSYYRSSLDYNWIKFDNIVLDPSKTVAPTSLADAAIVGGYVNKAHDLATQALTGTAQAGATVTVYDNGTALPGSVMADAQGKWSYTLGVLKDGSHSLTATAVDAGGIVSDPSSALQFTVDTQAPETMLTVSSEPAKITNATSATIQFSGTDTGGVGVDHYVVTVDGTASNNTTGSVSLSDLKDGGHTISVAAVDKAGNTDATPESYSWTVDTKAPETALTASSEPAKITNATSATIQFSGTDTGGVGVDHYMVTVDGTASNNTTGSVSLSDLKDGGHTISVAAVDKAGNTDATPESYSWTVDTQAPAAPTGLADAAIAGGYVNAAHQAGSVLTGTAEKGATVSLFDNGGSTAIATVTADATTGAFSFDLSKLADGGHSLTATATDAAGNTGAASAALAFKVDTSAPAAPTGLADAAVAGGYVNAAHQAGSVLTGTAEKGTTVSLFDNGGSTAIATVTADATTGAFSFDLSTLADGGHSLTATATDAAGNTGAASAALAFKVDTSAPAAPASLADAAIVGGYVNAAHQAGSVLTGTAEKGATVSLFDNGGSTAIATVTADATTGAFSFDLSKLADGSHSLTATATDVAGNTGAASAALAFKVDTAPPAAPASLADAAIGTNGYVNKVGDTDAQKLTGTAEKGAAVMVYDGGVYLGTATADASTGQWSYTLGVLKDGTHSLTATATDAAGNTGAASAALNVKVDATAPVTLITDITQSVTKTGSTTLVIGSSEAGSTVNLFDTDGTTVLRTANADATGSWSATLTNLSNVVHNFTAKATDLAGNVGSSSQVAIFGTTGNDVIKAVPGGGLIVGSTGNDNMTAGVGIDNFVFHANLEKNVISGFDVFQDILSFDHNLFAGITDASKIINYTADVNGNATVIVDPNDTVTLLGVTKAQLQAHLNDFHLL
ncbi:Ig-like domain-containing protein [Methylobacterium sp. WSM2598]|uniref:Ig-like domain-containing protein n=1 Tax=Methylobacterium sp. WSM2598 TaxID=398261 RepID=UPI0012F64584|nr:Ig-like domain-containing protein [Methylobacterium sp. WSM2598]